MMGSIYRYIDPIISLLLYYLYPFQPNSHYFSIMLCIHIINIKAFDIEMVLLHFDYELNAELCICYVYVICNILYGVGQFIKKNSFSVYFLPNTTD